MRVIDQNLNPEEQKLRRAMKRLDDLENAAHERSLSHTETQELFELRAMG